MERPNILSALKTKVTAIQASNSEKFYVHQGLIDGGWVGGAMGCTWSCFSGDIVKSFVEYLYQGDYTTPEPTRKLTRVLVTPNTPDTSDCDLLDWPDGSDTAPPSSTTPLLASKALDYEKVFLAHARLFILSRRRKALAISNMCLERLEDAMKEAKETILESIFVENMRALIRYTYNPCCPSTNSTWDELQKCVSGFLVAQKGWMLEVPASQLIDGEDKLAKDLLAGAIKLLVEVEEKMEALSLEVEKRVETSESEAEYKTEILKPAAENTGRNI
ncbi:hypothetical protein L873DRAFT_1166119 [Choiromyces venosus 120613-1]|uniref:BTB domain-containing protein n=1 Tax=Choiromyces venosus 120613-1 TaxID=1336337 RepID=A0A3N4JJ69_9PEZI|nr:hypothetical protein L873DRAFT_1166119 [Choiromyces venosus 120613-1]